MTPESSAPAQAPLLPLLSWAAVVGIVGSAAAIAFTTVEHHLQALLWTDLPESLGWSEVPAWWVFAVLITGSVLVWAGLKLPGSGGHRPMQGFAFDIGPQSIASVVLVALASLSFGAVLGPEAPLIAIGTAVAAALYRNEDPTRQQVLMMAGGMAGMGLILGNPLVTAILVLEGAAIRGSKGGQAALGMLMPVLVALGFGYLLQVGVGDWGGFGESVLAVPGLPVYDSVQVVDLLVVIPLSVVIAIVAIGSLVGGRVVEGLAARHGLATLVLGGAGIAAVAVTVSQVTGAGTDMTLFSGQAAIPELLAVGSVGSLVVIVAGKALAYALSLGAGFRGGQIFPAVFIGVALGTATSLIVGDSGLPAYVAGGVAAATAAVVRLPFTAVLLAVLLCSGAGLAVTSPAIVAAIVGLITRVAVDRRSAKEPAAALPAGAAAGG